jgi:hypothetical protein
MNINQINVTGEKMMNNMKPTIMDLKRMMIGETITVGSDLPITYHKAGYGLFIPLNRKYFSFKESWTKRIRSYCTSNMKEVIAYA